MRTLREEIMSCADGPVRVREADRDYEMTFRFPDDFTGFRGHFPGHPILPAFVQILMGQCALGLRGDRSWTLRTVDRGKFLKTIQPNRPVTIRWREQPEGNGLRCTFTLLVKNEKAAAFTCEFTGEDDGHA
jgi:3-hydroxyacyl-[acyl-carrier-protein] dehydratase